MRHDATFRQAKKESSEEENKCITRSPFLSDLYLEVTGDHRMDESRMQPCYYAAAIHASHDDYIIISMCHPNVCFPHA